MSGEPAPEAGTKRIGVLVLGLGNVLLGDDGLGAAAVARVARDYRVPASVHLEDGGTLGLSLLGLLAEAEHGKPAGRKSDTAAVVRRVGRGADISRHSKWSARDSDAIVVNSQRSANLGAGRLHNLVQKPIESPGRCWPKEPLRS